MLSRSFPTALNARCSLLSGRQRYSRTSTSGREKRNRRCQVSALTIESLPTVEEVFNFENLAVFPFWISMIGFPQIDIHENCHALPGDEHRVRFDLRILSVPILLRTGDFRGFQLWRPAKFIVVNERVLVRNNSCSRLGTLHSHGFTRRSVHLLRRS